jgi:tetratricopeptide (TPR) repeat protein/DNA-directed RNA polymerase subunit RPC12/RpoP
MKFCPECGSKLEGDTKYCPNCGFELKKDNDEDSVVNCENCGGENSIEETICVHCGYPLNKDKHPKASLHPAGKDKTNEDADKITAKTKTNNERKLKQVYIYLIFAAIFIISGVMFISSDMTDVPEASKSVLGEQSSGVNLNNVNQINTLKDDIEKNPADKDKILQLANLENDSGFFEQAITYYKKYLDLSPDDADVLVDMGVCYYNLQNYKEAVAKMTEALKYNPKHQVAHLNLGIVNLAMGNIEKSREWLEKTIKIDSTSEAGKRAKEILESHSQGGGI